MIYEGCTNYETYIVSAWIGNDEAEYNQWSMVADRLNDKLDLAETLKVAFENDMPELEGLWADLLAAGFSEVDWYDVADSLMEE